MSSRAMKTPRHRNGVIVVACLAFAFPERDITNDLADNFLLFDAIDLHFVQIRYIVTIICALLVVSPIYNPRKRKHFFYLVWKMRDIQFLSCPRYLHNSEGTLFPHVNLILRKSIFKWRYIFKTNIMVS